MQVSSICGHVLDATHKLKHVVERCACEVTGTQRRAMVVVAGPQMKERLNVHVVSCD